MFAEDVPKRLKFERGEGIYIVFITKHASTIMTFVLPKPL